MQFRLLIFPAFFALAFGPPALAQDEELFVAKPFTDSETFTKGIEGPACDHQGNLYAVSFGEKGNIGKVTPEGKASLFITLPEGSTGNGIRFDRGGNLFVADYTGHNVLRIDPKTKAVSVLAHEPKMNQPNDLAIGPDGTLFASDPNWKEKTGQLWRIDPDGTVALLAANMGTTNGIEVSPDGATLYVNESVQRKIWAFTLTEEKTITDKWLVKEFADHGFDGMRCDMDGNLYVTRHDAGKVLKMTPKGEILQEIDVLGSMPSNLCFGGPDGRTVYVTEVENTRVVAFRVDRPGLAWKRWQERPQIKDTSKTSGKKPQQAQAKLPAGMTAYRGIDYATYGDRKVALDVFVPGGEGAFPGVLLVHGGGWIGGQRAAFERFAVELAKRGYVVANIDYRLATEAKFPGAVLDCKAAVRWMRANAEEYRIDPDRIGGVGGSAGGHLTGMVATTAHDPEKFEESENSPGESAALQAAVLMGAGVDQVSRVKEAKNQRIENCVIFFGAEFSENPDIYAQGSPITHVSKETPPLLFLDGEFDRPGERYVDMRKKLDGLGVPNEFVMIPGAKHGQWGREPWLTPFVEAVDAFFKKHLE